MPPPDDELGLIVTARQGDADSFAILVRRYTPRLLRLAEHMAGDRSSAEDALQDAILAAWRKIGDFRGDAAFSTWLHTIVVRTCLTQIRRRQISESLDTVTGAERQWADPGYSVDPGDVVARAADTATLRAALDTLPAAYRAALVLHDVEGLTAAEIADATGVPLGTAKARIRRARIAMVSLLAATAEPNDRQEASGC